MFLDTIASPSSYLPDSVGQSFSIIIREGFSSAKDISGPLLLEVYGYSQSHLQIFYCN